LLGEEPGFEPLELGFPRRAEWSGRRGPQLKARFGAEFGRHSGSVLVHVFPFVHGYFGSISEKPAIDWQSRVFQKSSVRLEFQTPDAQKTRAALPNGHAAIHRRVLQRLDCKRGFHVQPETRNIIPGGLSNSFHRPDFLCQKLRCRMAAWC
jgi:hypothetical protein